jgi:hypothetical protein
MNLRQPCRVAIAAPPFLLAAAPASAHHVMGGRTPSTFLEGLLSGLAHPVIGPEPPPCSASDLPLCGLDWRRKRSAPLDG